MKSYIKKASVPIPRDIANFYSKVSDNTRHIANFYSKVSDNTRDSVILSIIPEYKL